MQIFVKGSGYAEGRTLTLDVTSSQSVGEVKYLLSQLTGIDYDSQRLLCGIHPLNDLDTLEEADVQSESTLVQCIELLGGAKKRKKKNFAKPKKGKHKKKKVKLAVLKLYKVDGNDQITRLRKECPMSSCGPGVFMALHRNRSYCGRCGGTFVSSTPAS